MNGVMKVKKLLAIMLIMAMLTAFAHAEGVQETIDADNNNTYESTSTEMAQILEKIKERMNLNTDNYDEFNSSYYDNGSGLVWNFNWSNDNGSLYIEVSPKGELISYSLYEYIGDPASDAPHVVEYDYEDIIRIADEFLKKALGEGEGYVLSKVDELTYSTTSDQYSLSGQLTLDDYTTETDITITVDAAKNIVTYFSRGDSNIVYVNDKYDGEIGIDVDAAKELLAENIKADLCYILESDGKAIPMYIMRWDDYIAAMANDGEVVNISELYRQLSGDENYYMVENCFMDAGSAGEYAKDSMTQAEIEKIEQMENTVSVEEADAKIRAIEGLGIDSAYEIASKSYSSYEDLVQLSISYEKAQGEDKISKNVCLNASTGEILSIYSYYPYSEEESKAPEADKYLSNAEAFLEQCASNYFGKCKLTDSKTSAGLYGEPGKVEYTFSRVENDIPYYGNYIKVAINGETGEIDSYSFNWDDELEFETPGTLISAEEAKEAYLEKVTPQLVLVRIPNNFEAGTWTWDYKLSLAYVFVGANSLSGGSCLYAVDPENGSLYMDKNGDGKYEDINVEPRAGISYDDTEGIPQQTAVETLAEYGIGFEGGKLDAEKELTLRDVLKLMLASRGLSSNELDDEALINNAIGWRIISDINVDLDQSATRAQLADFIIMGFGYGAAAYLKDIYVVPFADSADIPEEYFGSVAIAAGMGVAVADEGGNFQPNANATRIDGIEMLYNFMTRDI